MAILYVRTMANNHASNIEMFMIEPWQCSMLKPWQTAMLLTWFYHGSIMNLFRTGDGDMECRTRYMEMQVEIYGDAGGDSNSRIKELINTWQVQCCGTVTWGVVEMTVMQEDIRDSGDEGTS